jgi:hypothetical protein
VAALSIVAGFMARRSMALTPWALISVALVFYGISRGATDAGRWAQLIQLVLLGSALVVGVLQLRVDLVSGAAARRPPRSRWGSVLVALTAACVVITLGFPRLPLVVYLRGDKDRGAASGRSANQASYGRAVKVGFIRDRSLIEVSGIAASRQNPGAFWAHNDSGHPPELYCLGKDGISCGTMLLSGAENHDWEGIDVGPGPEPRESYVYVGDIGDNTRTRETVTVYRVREPRVGTSGMPSSVDAEAIRLRYPDGPRDAETLLIHPLTGDLYIVTKEPVSKVYQATPPFDTTDVTTLRRVARFRIFANFADRTGGDISPDGTRVVLATYGGVFELTLPDPDASFDAIWRVDPARVDSLGAFQLEAVTYSADGNSVLSVGEGVQSPIGETRLKEPVR